MAKQWWYRTYKRDWKPVKPESHYEYGGFIDGKLQKIEIPHTIEYWVAKFKALGIEVEEREELFPEPNEPNELAESYLKSVGF